MELMGITSLEEVRAQSRLSVSGRMTRRTYVSSTNNVTSSEQTKCVLQILDTISHCGADGHIVFEEGEFNITRCALYWQDMAMLFLTARKQDEMELDKHAC